MDDCNNVGYNIFDGKRGSDSSMDGVTQYCQFFQALKTSSDSSMDDCNVLSGAMFIRCTYRSDSSMDDCNTSATAWRNSATESSDSSKDDCQPPEAPCIRLLTGFQIPLWTIVRHMLPRPFPSASIVQIPLWTIVTGDWVTLTRKVSNIKVQIPLWTIVT